jgi:hypothetical protein
VDGLFFYSTVIRSWRPAFPGSTAIFDASNNDWILGRHLSDDVMTLFRSMAMQQLALCSRSCSCSTIQAHLLSADMTN